ncbi:MAG: phosphatase PAP2 family protein [Candidatus Latescibacterota bacterium]
MDSIRETLRKILSLPLHERHVRKLREKYPRASETIRKRFSRDERYGLHVTIGAALTLIFMWLFFDVFEEMAGEEEIVQTDKKVLLALHMFRSPVLNKIMLFFTTLGDWQVIGVGLACCLLFLILLRRRHQAASLFLSVMAGSLFITVLKKVVQRPRPPVADALMQEPTFSFPSGHSFIAFTFYGIIVYFLFKTLPKGSLRVLLAALGGCIILLVGFSRMFIGVHWPSDVLAGYASGAAWLTVHITALETYPDLNRSPLLRRPLLILSGFTIFTTWIAFLIYSYHANLGFSALLSHFGG